MNGVATLKKLATLRHAWAAVWLLTVPATLQAGEARPSAAAGTRLAVAGLGQPATITIDHWGIAHIAAQSVHDAFFLQGYNAARDRLWQIDLWRKRGLGLLARSLGPAYVEQDRAARLFLYRGDMQKEWSAYAPQAREVAEAFVAGVNAYVDAVLHGERPLPPEFGLTGSKPERWEAADVVRIRSHGLVGNLTSEVARAQVACRAGLDADRLRMKLEPAHRTKVPEGLDPCAIPPDVLKTYELGTAPVAFGAAKLAAVARGPSAEGSNNWVVSPAHSATGRPVLANDPHRSLSVPSLRYIVHLEAPGLSLVGAGEPALPGVSLGHNGHVAFGLTIFETDQEDLYVYALQPDDPSRYRYRKGYEALRTVTEKIEVRGQPAREVTLSFTRHGPVIATDERAHLAFAVRSVWAEPGTSPYFASTWLIGARTWQQFLAARAHWGTPSLNLVYADEAGNIGWAAGAKIPARHHWDGLLPVPGDGRYEWDGFVDAPLLPSEYNPAKGWFATANEMNLPAGYPADERNVSFEWANRSRIDRIESVLGGKPKLSLEDSMALQVDAHDVLSGSLIPLLAPLSSPDARVSRALGILRAWDRDESADSPAATIYQTWTAKFLAPMTVRQLTPEAVHKTIGAGDLMAVIDTLNHPDARLGADPQAARRDLLLRSLTATVNDLQQRLGAEIADWRWGRVHTMTFTPAIAALADPALRNRLILPSVALPGSSESPRAASFRDDFSVSAGASVRLVIDVGAWDGSRAVNTPGQSGDPDSKHYGDLLGPWAQGSYVPLLYSREAIEKEADETLVLVPAATAR